jgi:hypothetical protein
MANDTRSTAGRTLLGASVAALLALVVPPTATAQAATAAAKTTVQVSPALAGAHRAPGPGAVVLTFTLPAHRGAAAAPQSVSCTVNPSTPFRYYGGPYGGGEEGLAQVSCSAPVYEIQLAVALFSGSTQLTYHSTTAYGTTSSGADTEYPVAAGSYQTAAQATITAVYGGAAVTSSVYLSPAASLS